MIYENMGVNASQIGARIRQVRNFARLTQEELTRKVIEAGEEFFRVENGEGLISLHLSETEKGKRLPTVALLIAINRVLGCSLDEIIFGAPWRGLQSLTSRRCFVRPFDGPARNDFCAAIATRLGDDSDLLAETDNAFWDDREGVAGIGVRLREIRKTTGLSQEEAAMKLTLAGFPSSLSTLARAEKCGRSPGTDLPSLRFLIGFATVFDVSLDYVVLGFYASLDRIVGDLFSWIAFSNHRQAIAEMEKFCDSL